MNSERSYYNQPIRSLQTMLRTIALFSDEYQRIIPDGIYGAETQAAISIFQRNRGLPVTGITNQQTWDEVVRMYDSAVEALSPVQDMRYDLPADFPFSRGDHSARVRIAQFMLQEIAEQYACVCSPELTGRMDEVMVISISEFQNLNGLPATGKLDKTTWNALVLHYSLGQMMSNRHRK